jgi:hypothetical protein
VSAKFVLVSRSNFMRQVTRACMALLAVLLFQSPPGHLAFTQSPKPPAQPVTCATCHTGLVAAYAHAAMRNALESPGQDPILESHPNLSVHLGGYSYSVQTKDGRSTYTVSDGTDSLTLPIRWIFGQHSQTWVLEKDGNYYESLVSYFKLEQGLATTPGDGNIVPHSLNEAIGRKISVWEVIQCFNCHATDATDEAKLTFDKLSPGLGCKRCHLGAEQHMVDAVRNNFTTIPKPLKTMTAEDAANFCGQCHRTWESAVRNHWHGQADVRFQPYRLENSKCFTGNDQRISCLACHDPHQPINTNLAFYDSKCLACHAALKTSDPSSLAKTCPVGKANCINCHMPKVELPGGHAAFTDHQIRIVYPGDPYPD